MRDAATVSKVGVLEVPGEEVFGVVEAAAIDPQGHVYILDSRFSDVRVFAQDGTYLHRFGGAGQGPGEFIMPSGLAVLPTGDAVLVGDMGRRVHFFDASEMEARFSHSMTLSGVARGMCPLEDGRTLAVHAVPFSVSHVLELVLLPTGSSIAQFGNVYQSSDPGVNFQYAEGIMACSRAGDGRFFLAHRSVGEVRAYGTDGSTVWMARLADYSPVPVLQLEDGYEVRIPDEGFDRTESFVVLNSTYALLQVARVIAERGFAAPAPEVRDIASYIVDLSDGRGYFVGSDLPLIIAANSRSLVALQSDPFPVLTFLQMADP